MLLAATEIITVIFLLLSIWIARYVNNILIISLIKLLIINLIERIKLLIYKYIYFQWYKNIDNFKNYQVFLLLWLLLHVL